MQRMNGVTCLIVTWTLGAAGCVADDDVITTADAEDVEPLYFDEHGQLESAEALDPDIGQLQQPLTVSAAQTCDPLTVTKQIRTVRAFGVCLTRKGEENVTEYEGRCETDLSNCNGILNCGC